MSDAGSCAPLVVLVMGVSGAGKTRVGQALAHRLEAQFQDADAFHSEASIAKMRAGVSLSDADRAPWLDAVKVWIDDTQAAGRCGVIACSALRRIYRRGLIGPGARVALVHLDGDIAIIRARLEARAGHFMAPALLEAQQATLEPPSLEEGAVIADVAWPLEQQVDFIVRHLLAPE